MPLPTGTGAILILRGRDAMEPDQAAGRAGGLPPDMPSRGLPRGLPMHFSARTLTIALLAGVLVTTAGCGRLRAQRGYIMDETLTSAIKPGIDNKDSVAATLGRPTFAGQFDDADWYYISRNTRQLAFRDPRPEKQTILHVRFDAAGNVAEVKTSGLEQVASIDPEGDKTPTLGSERTLLQDIFGNVGAVGAPGATGGGGTSNDPTRP